MVSSAWCCRHCILLLYWISVNPGPETGSYRSLSLIHRDAMSSPASSIRACGPVWRRSTSTSGWTAWRSFPRQSSAWVTWRMETTVEPWAPSLRPCAPTKRASPPSLLVTCWDRNQYRLKTAHRSDCSWTHSSPDPYWITLTHLISLSPSLLAN